MFPRFVFGLVLPLLLPTPTIWFSLDHKQNVNDGVISRTRALFSLDLYSMLLIMTPTPICHTWKPAFNHHHKHYNHTKKGQCTCKYDPLLHAVFVIKWWRAHFVQIVIIIRIWTKYTWNYSLIPRLYHLITNQYQGWQIMLTIAGFLHVYYISWQILLLVADTSELTSSSSAWGMCHCFRPYLYLFGYPRH